MARAALSRNPSVFDMLTNCSLNVCETKCRAIAAVGGNERYAGLSSMLVIENHIL